MTSHIDDETTLEHPDRDENVRNIAAGVADLPPVMVTSNDARRLRAMLSRRRDRIDDAVLRFLSSELDRAIVCQPDIMPPNVVTMNSRVFFRRHFGQPVLSRTLVYDEDYAVVGGTLSVFTPLGAALLGLRDGSRMPYVSREGIRYVAVVERVAYQPEGEGRLQRAPYRYWPSASLSDERKENAPSPSPGKEDRRVVPLRPRVQPRPRPPIPPPDDDPGPNNAA